MCGLSQFGEIFQVKVLCKVNHSDLRQLLLVSKPVSEAVSTSDPSMLNPNPAVKFVTHVD